jgi:hypothetical protein
VDYLEGFFIGNRKSFFLFDDLYQWIEIKFWKRKIELFDEKFDKQIFRF